MSRWMTMLVVPLLLAAAVDVSAVDGSPPQPPRTNWPLEAVLTLPGQNRALGLALLRTTAAPKVCWKITVKDVTLPATAAHVHRSGAGESGRVVLALTPPSANGHSSGCKAADAALVVGLRTRPQAYALDVHTTSGVLRGEIRPFGPQAAGIP